MGHIELALAAWVQASRPESDEEAVALDGKAVRGAATGEHKAPHLLAFCTHDSQETLLQVRVSEKTNEIPIAKAVLPCLPRHPRVYTADALHTHADFMEVAHAHSGACALTVKGNQPNLYTDLTTYFNDPHTVIAPFEQDDTLDRHRGRDSPAHDPGQLWHERLSGSQLAADQSGGALDTHGHGAQNGQDD
ncbi:MAG: ISAs1 family transposase [Ktedonobacteraceae bacterium]